MAIKVDDWIHSAADDFVKSKYLAQADFRQQAMGLSYVTAEQGDLIREFAAFARAVLKRSV